MKSQTQPRDSKNQFYHALNTALADAVENNNLKMVRKALHAGAHPSSVGVLEKASRRGYYDIVLLLLAHGSNPNQISEQDHRTPLHLATLNYETKIISLLLHFGAQADILDINGESPLSIARNSTKSLEVFLNFFSSQITVQTHIGFVLSILEKEAARWFNTVSDRSSIKFLLNEFKKEKNTLESLVSLIKGEEKLVIKDTNLYFALQLCDLYLKLMINKDMEAKQKSAQNPPLLRLPPSVAPSAPLPEAPSPVINEEPGSTSDEEQIEGQSPLAKLSLLANKSSAEQGEHSDVAEKPQVNFG